jgi:hypothetical protein
VVAQFHGEAEAGRYYQRTFDAKNLAGGLYFYRLEAAAGKDPNKSFVQVRTMLMIK